MKFSSGVVTATTASMEIKRVKTMKRKKRNHKPTTYIKDGESRNISRNNIKHLNDSKSRHC